MKLKTYILLLICCLTQDGSALAGLANQDDVDNNHQTYNTCMLRYKDTTQIFTTADSVILATLCAKCPYTEGFVVFRARALFNMVYHTIESFTDDCNIANGSRLANKTTAETEQQLKIELYPNPNNGSFIISTENETDELIIKILDVTGKEIYNRNLTIVNFTNNLDLDFKSGIYFVEIQSKVQQTKTTKKLVIQP